MTIPYCSVVVGWVSESNASVAPGFGAGVARRSKEPRHVARWSMASRATHADVVTAYSQARVNGARI